MKYLIKKYWLLLIFALIVNVPLVFVCSYRTDQALILKGDTTKFTSVVSVDTDYETKGSFSTIYVTSMERSTIFQNWITDNIKTVERYTMSSSETHISDSESYQAGKIQYNSSIESSIILAYTYAMKEDSSINIEYSLSYLEVTYYDVNSVFRIGDRITKINDIDVSNYIGETITLTYAHEADTEKGISAYEGDKITYTRDGKEYETYFTRDNYFSAYRRYNINYNTISPKLSISSNMIGGPSGGLLQTLSIYNQLVEEDLTHGLKIAGTGTIGIVKSDSDYAFDGTVGAIGGIREKVPTALDDDIDVFFCVDANYEDALDAYNSLSGHEKMKLIKVSTFKDALNYLKEGYKDDFE